MTKTEFIAAYVAKNFPTARPGTRSRVTLSDEQKAAAAERAWNEYMSPNKVRARELVAAGGKMWEGSRVYFNGVKIDGHEFDNLRDVYFDIGTGEWHGDQSAIKKVNI